jgi:sugar phosphate isomerase/epimerase
VYVACSTLCFGRATLPQALRTISELQFGKVDVALHEDGPHLKPSEVLADPARAAQLLRSAPSLAVAAFHVRLGSSDPAEFAPRLRAVCRLARLCTVPLLCLPAAPLGTDFDAEVERLTDLQRLVASEGLILTVETHAETLTADPAGAAELCQRVRGLGLTLDPSHYVLGPHAKNNHDALYPFVRHVRLRDTSAKLDAFQVRIGQGDVEYGRVLAQLARFRYKRVLTVDVRDQPPPSFPVEPELRKLKFLLESLI